MRRELADRQRDEERKRLEDKITPEQRKREAQLINKITTIFRQREISFFDCLGELYDPLAAKNVVALRDFKQAVRALNLPLTVQDQRILRRVADPRRIGKVDLHEFCSRFETLDLRTMRLNKTLDKVAFAWTN